MNPIYPIFSLTIISFISLIGGIIIFFKNKKLERKLQIYLISFSAGSLLSTALLHLLPEAAEKIENLETIGLITILGIIFSFIVEKIICWRHCHIPVNKSHPHRLAYMNIFGDLLHNFIDGIGIIAAYKTNLALGISTSFAIASHELPQEIADFGILLYSGLSFKKALLYNFLTSLSAFAGAGAEIFLSRLIPSEYLLPIIIGNFIYIATADLIPELNKEENTVNSFLQIFLILVGIASIVVL